MATPENRVTTHNVDFSRTTVDPLRTEERTVTDPAGVQALQDWYSDGTVLISHPQLGTTKDTLTADPRFGFGAAYVASRAVTAGSKQYTETTVRQTSMTNVSDPFSVTSETEAVTGTPAGGWTQAFDRVASTITRTSSVGRQVTSTLDAWDRVTQIDVAGALPGAAAPLATTFVDYDTSGRVYRVRQGARSITAAFDSNGWLASVTTPLGQVTYPAPDAMGRPTQVVLPGRPYMQVAYDAVGNVTQINTPLGYAHGLAPNPLNLLGTYVPPTASSPTGSTSYSYDNDSLLLATKEPQATATYDRDSAGRIQTVAYPTSTGSTESLSYSYDAAGRVSHIQSQLGNALDYFYDGDMELPWPRGTGPPRSSGIAPFARRHGAG